jgi:hypothetical protein
VALPVDIELFPLTLDKKNPCYSTKYKNKSRKVEMSSGSN